MEVSKINSVSNSQNFKQNNVKASENSNPTEVKDGKKKLALTLGALAITGAAVVAGVMAAKKGKLNIKKFDDIKFDKGIALDKNGSKFSGTVKDALKNGDKIELNYKDGVIKSSKRTGSQNWTKIFGDKDYDYIATTSKDGKLLRGFFKENSKICTQDFEKSTVRIFDTSTGRNDVLHNVRNAVLPNKMFKNVMKEHN